MTVEKDVTKTFFSGSAYADISSSVGGLCVSGPIRRCSLPFPPINSEQWSPGKLPELTEYRCSRSGRYFSMEPDPEAGTD